MVLSDYELDVDALAPAFKEKGVELPQQAQQQAQQQQGMHIS
jgi:hypothetical protein